MRITVLLGLQTALLGAIGSSLRAVACSWDNKRVSIRAIFDGAISSFEYDEMSVVETEVLSHFPECEVTLRCFRIDAPNQIVLEEAEVLVFHRRE
ncbi:hypothetical protein PsAD13_04158 [Pseudovibrio sp. Ad13]|uniref:hypothetical protein n=1 Tax=Pseudovibrio sp. Ad13 TaxID=989396 RepID=UPI0007AE9CA3|nr:hypothetical protein [Pseudovibrio sp. Ad13]KZK81210.1 hypothetical protein PsAD13_04158 [Pseudovibrio sp. Ad13]